MALFGRDSILTSYMALPVDPTSPLGTLQTLADLQGTKSEPITEEQPGRSCTRCGWVSTSSLALGGGKRLLRHGGRDAAVRDAAGRAAALGRRRRDGDHRAAARRGPRTGLDRRTTATGTGTASWSTSARTDQGLVNQGWKDSWDGINFADGPLAEPPDRAVRGAGLRLQRLPGRADCSPAPPATMTMRSAGGRAAGAEARVQRAILACPTAATSPSRSTATNGRSMPARPTWATACGPGSSTTTRPPRRRPPAVPGDVHRLGRAHPGDRHGRVQPGQLPQRLGVAPRQRPDRRRTDALRASSSRPTGSPSRLLDARRTRSAAGCRSCSAGSIESTTRSPSRTRHRVPRRPGHPLRRSRCCAVLPGSTRAFPDGQVWLAPTFPRQLRRHLRRPAAAGRGPGLGGVHRNPGARHRFARRHHR